MTAVIDPLAQPLPRAWCKMTRRNAKSDKALTLRLGLKFVNYICVVSFHAPTLFSTTISPGQFHMYAIEAKGLVKQFDGFSAVAIIGQIFFAILLLRLGVYLFKKNVMKSGSAGRAKDEGARRLFGFIKMPG